VSECSRAARLPQKRLSARAPNAQPVKRTFSCSTDATVDCRGVRGQVRAVHEANRGIRKARGTSRSTARKRTLYELTPSSSQDHRIRPALVCQEGLQPVVDAFRQCQHTHDVGVDVSKDAEAALRISTANNEAHVNGAPSRSVPRVWLRLWVRVVTQACALTTLRDTIASRAPRCKASPGGGASCRQHSRSCSVGRSARRGRSATTQGFASALLVARHQDHRRPTRRPCAAAGSSVVIDDS
jgi:hypothetical protein